MNEHTLFAARGFRLVLVSICLAIAQPAIAQDPRALQSFRTQYDVMMSNFERMYAAKGDAAGQARARQGREAMQRLTTEQLAKLYAQMRVPDLSVSAIATDFLVSRMASRGTPQKSLPFPGAPGLVSGCDGVDIDATTRYSLLIVKEVSSSILAAATFVCTQDILGENGSTACVPLSIAADVANGFFETAAFCAGEVTANQVDGSYNRLQHIHDDLSAGNATNTAAIISNDNANKDAIVSELRALGCEIVRLLNTPEGLRASSILSCSSKPGFPYHFPK